MQHFATFLYATFLKKYVIKNCRLEKVCKKFSYGLLLYVEIRTRSGIGNGIAFFIWEKRRWLVRVKKENNILGLADLFNPFLFGKPSFMGKKAKDKERVK